MSAFELTGTKCYYCGDPLVYGKLKYGDKVPPNMKTRDHRIPKSKGGKGLPNNQVDCCFACNTHKNDLSEMQFIQRGGRFV